MLTVALEGYVVLTEESLEELRPDNLLVAPPHLSDEFGPCLHESALCAEWVLPLAVDEVFVFTVEEETRKLVRVTEALNATVHIASVTEVAQADFAIVRTAVLHVGVLLIELLVCISSTLIDVVFYVLLEAILIAVLDISALANDV